MSGYIGTQPVPQATQTRQTFVATAAQTSFATGGYQAGYLDVFLNGVKLQDNVDYTATNGSDIVLTVGAALDDTLEVVAYTAFEVLDQTFTGTTTVDVLTTTGAFTSLGIDDNAAATAVTIDASGNVGIGTAAAIDANTQVQVNHSGSKVYALRVGDETTVASTTGLLMRSTTEGRIYTAGGAITFGTTGGGEKVRIDSSGNVLVGATDRNQIVNNGTTGIVLGNDGFIGASRTGSSGEVMVLDREDSDGGIITFRKDGTTVGSIGSINGDTYLNTGSTGLRFFDEFSQIIPCGGNGSSIDNAIDLGRISVRFDDIYATNGTIQTSDRNEKEAIASLTPTEMLVAARLSCCFKNFKWKDAVAEKGLDAARMHSGIIAQDVQDAFAAEGLDASDYAMFISGTWWEHEGTAYDTLEEAPEGATERTRLGIRYPELLAFVAAYSDQRFLTIEARLTALEVTP